MNQTINKVTNLKAQPSDRCPPRLGKPKTTTLTPFSRSIMVISERGLSAKSPPLLLPARRDFTSPRGFQAPGGHRAVRMGFSQRHAATRPHSGSSWPDLAASWRLLGGSEILDGWRLGRLLAAGRGAPNLQHGPCRWARAAAPGRFSKPPQNSQPLPLLASLEVRGGDAGLENNGGKGPPIFEGF